MLPLDGSDLANCSLAHAVEIARGCNVPSIDLVTVVRNFFWWQGEVTDPQVYEEVEEAEEAKAKEFLAKVKAEFEQAGLKANTVILKGIAADAIIDYAEKNGVDLILMTTHGRSGITRFALGSVTDKVIRTVTMPVLIISPPGCRVPSA